MNYEVWALTNCWIIQTGSWPTHQLVKRGLARGTRSPHTHVTATLGHRCPTPWPTSPPVASTIRRLPPYTLLTARLHEKLPPLPCSAAPHRCSASSFTCCHPRVDGFVLKPPPRSFPRGLSLGGAESGAPTTSTSSAPTPRTSPTTPATTVGKVYRWVPISATPQSRFHIA
jgi:hypothetical protein